MAKEMNSLQKMILPKGSSKNLIKNLYVNTVKGRNQILDDSIVMYDDGHITFNSFFNSFYEAYWFGYTKIQNLSCQVQVTGKGRVSVYRDTERNGCYEIASVDFDYKKKTKIDIPLVGDEFLPALGRIFVDIKSIVPITQKETNDTSTLIVHDIQFSVDQSADKKLSIGICTFNREDFLYGNLVRLVDFQKTFSPLVKIFVVNQGESFSEPKLLDLIATNEDLITVISQGNMGGTGGFTRTIYEALEFNNSDFHLLMDDDVIIDPQVVETAYNFASRAKQPIAVGGQMMDLLRPNIMHEYGGIVNNTGHIKPQLSGMMVDNLSELIRFNTIKQIDFNAWWFCMLPLAEVKKIQLPAPIFIRGDDQEYGFRLKNAGVETVGLPGVALWHEPFYVKVGGWQTYYDYRNRMILASSYDSLKPEEPKILFLKVMRLLLCHDYQSAQLILQAIKDYSKGKQLFLSESSEQIHKRVVELSKKNAPEKVDVVFTPVPDDQTKPKLIKNARRKLFGKQIAQLAAINFSKKTVKHLFDRHVTPENVACHPYIKSNGIQSYHFLYQPNRATFIELLKEMIEVRKLYIETVHSNKWKDIEQLKKTEYWDSIFR